MTESWVYINFLSGKPQKTLMYAPSGKPQKTPMHAPSGKSQRQCVDWVSLYHRLKMGRHIDERNDLVEVRERGNKSRTYPEWIGSMQPSRSQSDGYIDQRFLDWVSLAQDAFVHPDYPGWYEINQHVLIASDTSGLRAGLVEICSYLVQLNWEPFPAGSLG